MIEIDKDEGEELARNNVCGECKGELTVAWGGYYGINGHVLRCGRNRNHKGIDRIKTPSELYREGAGMDVAMTTVLEKKLGKRRVTTMGNELVPLTEAQKTKALKNIETSFKGALVPSEQDRAVSLMDKGFDPAFHLALYQNKITLTIDGYFWWAGRKDGFVSIISEPILDPELKEAYGVNEGEIGVIAKLYIKDSVAPFCTGFGRASKNSQTPVIKGSFVENAHPYRMAEKRAEAQAIRKWHPVGMDVQGDFDASDGNHIEGEYTDITPEDIPFEQPPVEPPLEATESQSEPTEPTPEVSPALTLKQVQTAIKKGLMDREGLTALEVSKELHWEFSVNDSKDLPAVKWREVVEWANNFKRGA